MNFNTFTNLSSYSKDVTFIAEQPTDVSSTSKFIETATSLPVCYSLGGLAIVLILTGICRELLYHIKFNTRSLKSKKLSDMELLEKIWQMEACERITENGGDKNLN